MRRWLLVLAIAAPLVLQACADEDIADEGSSSDSSADTDRSIEADLEHALASSLPPTASTLMPVPPSAACELAADIVEDDVAISLALEQASADIVEALQASLTATLAELVASGTQLAGPATGLAGARFDQGAVGAELAPAAGSLDAAMLDECALRLAGAGVLRPSVGAGDRLDGLGLTALGEDTCESAAALRWADAHWRVAADGGERDRLTVIVRNALGMLRLDDDADLDLPADIERADLSGGSLTPEHRIAIVRLDADLQRACDDGLQFGGLLLEGSRPPTAAAIEALPTPDWAEPRPVTADVAHARWCAIADDIYSTDVAAATSEAYGFERHDHIGVEMRLLLGALRVASRSGGSVATLADVRDALAAASILERADFSESGLLDANERRAVGELDRVIVASCGVGLSPSLGILGRYAARPESDDPDAQSGNVPTTVAAPETSTTSTSLPIRLPNADVAVVGDSLTLGAQAEITATLGRLGLGVVIVDGQVSRRMTSSTDTIRSGLDVVEEIALASTPKIWVIALGTNDVASGSSSASIRQSVDRVLEAIPPDALVVWVDTWIRDERDAVMAGNQIIRDVVIERQGAVVADFFSYGDDDGIVGSDGVHLTTAGRRLFANVMANGIATVLGRNPTFDLGAPTTTVASPVVTDPQDAPTNAPTTSTAAPTTSTSTSTTTSSTTSTTSTIPTSGPTTTVAA